jgi:threonine dehydrogenase-like Zn-dependent dehydrogenase
MKALVYHKPGTVSVDTIPDPKIEQARDCILRVTSTAICGSDLHILRGGIPQPRPMVLGHEFMGIVEEVGPGNTRLKVGDRVVVPFPIACGSCWFCTHSLHDHCENSNPENYGPEGGLTSEKGGALFGYSDLYGGYDGGQAEFVRIPYSDIGPRLVPEGLSDEQVLFCSDIFPTGWTAVEWCQLKGGETVAIFGAGPVGIMAAKSAWLQGAARVLIIDPYQYRLNKAAEASKAEGILWTEQKEVVKKLRDLTNGRGPDACIDAVGYEPERNLLDRVKAVVSLEKGSMKVLEACMSAVRRGGVVSVVGVYAAPFDNFPLGQFFDKGILLRGGQSYAHERIDMLLKLVQDGKVVLEDIITHTMPLASAEKGYDIFKNKEDNCVKVVLKP